MTTRTIKGITYPDFEVNGKWYGSILTPNQMKQYESVKDAFMELGSDGYTRHPNIRLWLSKRLTLSDVMELGGYCNGQWDVPPQDWANAHREDVERTPYVWLYRPISEGGSHFGEPFAPFHQLLPRIEGMVYNQWLVYVESLMENKE